MSFIKPLITVAAIAALGMGATACTEKKSETTIVDPAPTAPAMSSTTVNPPDVNVTVPAPAAPAMPEAAPATPPAK